MKLATWAFATITCFVLTGVGNHVAAKEGAKKAIPLADVPQAVKDAAIKAVPGLVLQKAERKLKKEVVVYELEGKAGGVEYEVKVTADGKVLEVEKEGDEDDDDKDKDK